MDEQQQLTNRLVSNPYEKLEQSLITGTVSPQTYSPEIGLALGLVWIEVN